MSPSSQKTPSAKPGCSFGPIYEVADATYIVKPGSAVTNFSTLDQAGVKVAAVNNTTTMRGAIAHLKNAKVTGYQTYDDIFNLLKNGEIDAFALSRDQLNAMARKIPGTRVLDETFKQTVTAIAVPLSHPLAAAFAARFMTEATTNGTLRKAYDNNGLKDYRRSGRRRNRGRRVTDQPADLRGIRAVCPKCVARRFAEWSRERRLRPLQFQPFSRAECWQHRLSFERVQSMKTAVLRIAKASVGQRRRDQSDLIQALRAVGRDAASQ